MAFDRTTNERHSPTSKTALLGRWPEVPARLCLECRPQAAFEKPLSPGASIVLTIPWLRLNLAGLLFVISVAFDESMGGNGGVDSSTGG